MIAQNEKEKIIGIIKLFVPQAIIYIFGSHARGDTTKTSDLDIALDQGSQIPHELLGELRSVLDGLWLSYKIDLIDFQKSLGKITTKYNEKTYYMEKLVYKYESICNAAMRLKEALDEFKKCKQGTVQYEITRDSVIQRFEFTFDTFWKFLRIYLMTKHGVTTELVGSKSVFKIALEGGILPAEHAHIYYAMIDDRNKTSHTYDGFLAQEIVGHIPQYWRIIDDILEKYKEVISKNE